MRGAQQGLAAAASGSLPMLRRLAVAVEQRCSLAARRRVPLAAGRMCGWRPRPRQRKGQRLQAWCRVLYLVKGSMRVLE